jgi:hypothetical protein
LSGTEAFELTEGAGIPRLLEQSRHGVWWWDTSLVCLPAADAKTRPWKIFGGATIFRIVPAQLALESELHIMSLVYLTPSLTTLPKSS